MMRVGGSGGSVPRYAPDMNETNPELRSTELENGLVVITERHASRRSASVCWLVPGGVGHDPRDHGDGWATMLSEFLLRGAGSHDSRSFSDALDRLGTRRSVAADSYHMRISATAPGPELPGVLDLLGDLVMRPRLPASGLEPVRALCLQELAGIEDDPAHLVGIRLDEIRYPVPFERHGLGTESHLRAATRDGLAEHWERISGPKDSIIAIAGAVDHDRVVDHLRRATESWTGGADRPTPVSDPEGGIRRLPRDTSQVHLALGLGGPVAGDPDALPFRVAVGILGGGTSSRLFLDVRERRGLAYAVGSRYDEGLALGAVTISAGTTPDRVSETLERIDAVLEEYDESGPTDEEIRRIVVMLRASGLMQQEEGPSRARQLALDRFRLGHPRSMAEILASYASVEPDDVRRVARDRLGASWRAAATRCLLGPAEAIGAGSEEG